MGNFYVYLGTRPNGTPCYVGKGAPRTRRIYSHTNALKIGRHTNLALQNVFNKYGSITWSIIHDGLSEEEAFSIERALIKGLGRKPNGPLCNLTDGGEGASGTIISKEVTERRVAKILGMKHSVEARRNMSEGQRRRAPPTSETRAKMSANRSGTRRLPESSARAAEKNRGKKRTDEMCLRISNGITPQERAARSQRLKERLQSPDFLAKRTLGRWTHERRKKHSEQMKLRWLIRRNMKKDQEMSPCV